jgi:spore coat protein CotH
MDVCGLGVLCCLRRYQTPRINRDVDNIQVQLDTTQMGEKIILYCFKKGKVEVDVDKCIYAVRSSKQANLVKLICKSFFSF